MPFTCSVDRAGLALDDAESRLSNEGHLSDHRRADEFRSPFIAQRSTDLTTVTATYGTGARRFVGVGEIRLDNRPDIIARTDGDGTQSDLELLLRLLARGGLEALAGLVGAVACVVWDRANRRVIAVRDALGLGQLYLRERGMRLTFASQVLALDAGETYDLDFIAEFLLHGYDSTDRTIVQGTGVVPPGTVVIVEPGRVWTKTLWTLPVAGYTHIAFTDAVDQFRQLFATAVCRSLSGRPDTWAELSGGLDSSSVVCMAQELLRSGAVSVGVSGTVTNVDTLGSGDEREFSDEVVRVCGVPNVTLKDYWMWQDDGAPPTLEDQPYLFFPFYARYRRLNAVLNAGHSRVLLTGVGPDHFLAGYLSSLGDRFLRGHVASATRDVAAFAIARRSSVWRYLYRHLVYPNLPTRTRVRFAAKEELFPRWIHDGFAQRHDLLGRTAAARRFAAPLGRKSHGETVFNLRSLTHWPVPSSIKSCCDVRHPFLYRPLVEFAARLPPEWLITPDAQKFIMREAMRGVLPERVRTRDGKGTMGGRLRWSLVHEAERIRDLVRDPILAQLGCIDRERLRRGVRRAQDGKLRINATLLPTLALESWLRVHSGTWLPLSARDTGRPSLTTNGLPESALADQPSA